MGFVSGGWEGEGVCNGVGSGGSGRSRFGVRTRLKGETVTGNGLGGIMVLLAVSGRQISIDSKILLNALWCLPLRFRDSAFCALLARTFSR